MVETTADSTYQKGQLYSLSLSEIRIDPNQPRRIMEPQALDELTASVTRLGVLQPILFRTDDGGHDQISSEIGIVSPEVVAGNSEGLSDRVPGNLPPDAPICYVVAGERRVAASRQAGLTSIPGICVDGKVGEIALVENLLRQDLTAVEEAEALQRLLEEQNYTHDQLSTVIGKARSTITDILLINRLPLEVRDDCRGDRRITKTTLIEIARKKQARSMTSAYKTYKEKLEKVKQPRKKTSAAEPLDVIYFLEKTIGKISDLDASAWVEEDKTTLYATLSKLKAQIEAFMANPESEINTDV